MSFRSSHWIKFYAFIAAVAFIQHVFYCGKIVIKVACHSFIYGRCGRMDSPYMGNSSHEGTGTNVTTWFNDPPAVKVI